MPLKLKSLACTTILGLTTSFQLSGNLVAQDKAPLAAAVGSEYQSIDLAETSLRYADADVSFYSGSYQLDVQWDHLLNSNFVQGLINTAYGQKLKTRLLEQWEGREGPMGQARMVLTNPNVEPLIALLKDFTHEEIFVLGSNELVGAVDGISTIVKEVQPLIQLGERDLLVDYVHELDKERIDSIRIPTILVGGKITDKEAAQRQLDVLQGILVFGLGNQPETKLFADAIERIEDERGVRLAMTLKTEMIPWHSINTGGDVEAEDMLEHLQELLAGRSIAVTIGTLDDYLVLGLSETTQQLLDLGNESSLLESPDMKMVRDKTSEAIVGVMYNSDELAEVNFEYNLNHFFAKNWSQLIDVVETEALDDLVDYEAEDADEKEEQVLDVFDDLREDLVWLDEEIGQHVPQFKGQTVVSVGHEDGIETWNHLRTEQVLRSVQPTLPILEHVGGEPLLMVAGRNAYHPEYFATCRNIVQRIKARLDAIHEIVEDDSEPDRALTFVSEKVWPLLGDLANTIQDDFIPATEDGQFAFIISKPTIVAKQWLQEMPPSSTDLPFVEVAKVIGVTDSGRLIGGFEDLYSIGDRVVDLIREQDPRAVPAGYVIPRPESETAGEAPVFSYRIPEECPVPETMAVTARFEKDFAYFGFSRPQQAALVKSTPWHAQADFVSAADSISLVSYVNLGAIATSYRPWMLYAIEQGGDLVIPEEELFPELRSNELLEIYDVLGNIGEFVSVESGTDNGSSIMHSRYFEKK